MITKLIIASGKSAGRAISLKRNKLLIGRAEECDVRPLSEEVSRRHCAVYVGPGGIFVEDLSSRNGTFVNGVRIVEKTQVSNGDSICVGSLELKVSCVEAVTKESDNDVSRWLMADESPAGMFDTTHSLSSVATAAVGEPEPLDAVHRSNPSPGSNGDESSIHSAAGEVAGASGISKSASMTIAGLKEAKAKPGMLGEVPKKSADSSRDAAADALKKLFGNR